MTRVAKALNDRYWDEVCGMAGWQAIETAPKDGTRILAWRSGDIFIARWHKMLDAWCDEKEVLRPTHWVPLPEPPSVAK